MEKIASSFMDYGSTHLSELAQSLNCGMVFFAGMAMFLLAIMLFLEDKTGPSIVCFGISVSFAAGNIWWIAKKHEAISPADKNNILNISLAIIIVMGILIVIFARSAITSRETHLALTAGGCLLFMLASIGVFMETLYFA